MAADDPRLRVQARKGDEIDTAIERGVAFLKKQQLPSGAWIAMEYFEPRTSALHLVTLKFIDRLSLVEARGFAHFLATLQRPDGSFPAYPSSPYPSERGGDLCATALVYAALYAADLDDQKAVRKKTLDWINKHGGFDAVVKKLYSAGDMTALYLSMVDLVDPFKLSDPHLAFMLAPPAVDLMLRQVNAGVLEGFLFLAGITRYLREKKKPSPAWIKLIHEREACACIAFIEGWLNPNGNNNGTTVQTDQAIATLVALGRTPEDPCVFGALQWFGKLKIWDERGCHLRAFTNENWVTAFALRALLFAGVPRTDKSIKDGLDYLCWSQSKLPMPEVNMRRKDGHRVGGWGFEEDNLILPDTDDTSMVLSALGLALDRGGLSRLDDARQQRVQDATDLGLQNLLDMQSDDGGWAGFVWNLGSKGPGPLFNKPIGIPDNLIDAAKLFLDPPLELKEVPVEDLTGRVLQGLGANGYGPTSPEVQRAVKFLKERQLPDGSFWARWIVGYITSTSCVLSGMADCGCDLSQPWVKKAVDYLLKQQNADGGWGESAEAFEHPDRGIKSKSMPPLTGIALTALVDIGMGNSEPAQRAVKYLIKTQADDGSWPNNDWLQIYEPYATYYVFDGDAWYRPVEALAKLRRFNGKVEEKEAARNLAPLSAPAPTFPAGRKPGTWSKADLRKMRMAADRTADDVIGALYAEGKQGALRQLMGQLVTTDDPLPPGLPKKARDYFEKTEPLPSWADPDKMLRGQRLFTRHGWLMATGLLCSSLPQAYCAANGARVLTQTQGMTRHVYRRILETAQFLFDVCVEGSMAKGGTGVRAAQKVRLMHATIRHLVMLKGEWDVHELGLPVNQEDYAGTLMTFSVVLLDACKTAGITVDKEDEDAFVHLWKVVGHYLGLDHALLPVDPADARALMQAIRDDQWQESVQGRLLAADLIHCIEGFTIGPLDDLPEALIAFFAPKNVPKLLDIKDTPLLDLVLKAGSLLDVLLGVGGSDEDRLERLVHILSRNVMIGLIDVQREGKQTGFRIPDGLVRDWQLSD